MLRVCCMLYLQWSAIMNSETFFLSFKYSMTETAASPATSATMPFIFACVRTAIGFPLRIYIVGLETHDYDHLIATSDSDSPTPIFSSLLKYIYFSLYILDFTITSCDNSIPENIPLFAQNRYHSKE